MDYALACISPRPPPEGYGQIYVGFVNWTLMVLTLVLTVSFRSSDNLASAFGIAVALTMLLTSMLIFLAMREVWGWSLWLSARGRRPVRHRRSVLCGREHDEGVRGRLGAARGRSDPLLPHVHLVSRPLPLLAKLERDTLPLADFISQMRAKARVPGTAVYMTSRTRHGARTSTAQSEAQ